MEAGVPDVALACFYAAIIAVLVGSEDLSRPWIASRQPSLAELAANCAGLTVFGWLAVRIWRRCGHSGRAERS